MNLLGGRWLLVVTGLLAAIFVASAWADGELDRASAGVLIAVNTVPLLLIKRNPLLVVLIFAIAYPVWLGALGGVAREGHFLQSLPTLLALYATGAWRRSLWLRALGLVTPAWMLLAVGVGMWSIELDEIFYVVAVLVISWGFGVVDARRRAYAEQLETRTRELEQARRALAEQELADERARIARELHDVVAHAMSVITVQAGVGGHLLADRPQRAADALAVIERTGREALAELRRMLVVLRPDAATGPHPPQPGIADLPGLVDNARAAGLQVVVSRTGAWPTLPTGLDLAVYRVIQEALTNAAKHAQDSRVELHLTGTRDRISIDVVDDGPGNPQVRRGQGLTGMAERVALYDGTLAVDGTGGGFRLRASFPIAPDTAVEGRR
nr:sensor histidine kinase [Phytoactinopolyspora alkaliphila]